MDLEWVQQRQEKKVQASFISEITFFKEILLFGFVTNTDWAFKLIALGLSASIGVLLNSWNVSEDPVFGDDVWGSAV